jgi:predicted TIM-barrel fold metal-dependent hydrolase
MMYKHGPNPVAPEWVDRASSWSRYAEQPDMTDPRARVAQVESLGAVGEVVNPSSGLFFGTTFRATFGTDRDVQQAVRWAYLRWFADYCGAVPGRLAGTIPVESSCTKVAPGLGYDIDAALAKVRWAREHGLFGGVLAPSPGDDVPALHDAFWEPLWALCSELELPIVFHGGCHGPIQSMDVFASAASLAVDVLESGFQSKRNFWMLMAAGVFDRYPNLKTLFVEQHVTSMPGILAEFDHIASTTAPNAGSFGTLRSLKMLPSEYWIQHGLFGAPFLRPEETALLRDSHIGLSTTTWGADYPHIEGVYPDFTTGLRYAFGGLPEDEIRAIVGGTAAKAFGFDLAALQTLADRVGPTVEELATPLPDSEIPRYTFSGAYDITYPVPA